MCITYPESIIRWCYRRGVMRGAVINPARKVGIWWMLMAIPVPACALQCGDNSSAQRDGGPTDGALITIDGSAVDAAPPLTFVDFAIGGCESRSEAGHCIARSPATLRFAPITSSPVSVYLWNFGDGENSSEPSVRHTFNQPGIYGISLDVEGPGGGFGVTKPGFVEIEVAVLGSPCRADSDCLSSRCICDPSDGPCPPVLTGRGICSAECDSLSPCEQGVCVNLNSGMSPTGQDWQRSLCLPSCTDGCPETLVCASVLSISGEWTQACMVPGLVAPIGASCVLADGSLGNSRCASGRCLDLGVRGLCGFDCSTIPCPPGTTCANFNGSLGSQCLADCDTTSCEGDPWLACTEAGHLGANGFVIAGQPPVTQWCSVKFCADDPSVCGSFGQCSDGHCGP